MVKTQNSSSAVLLDWTLYYLSLRRPTFKIILDRTHHCTYVFGGAMVHIIKGVLIIASSIKIGFLGIHLEFSVPRIFKTQYPIFSMWIYKNSTFIKGFKKFEFSWIFEVKKVTPRI